MAFRTVRKNSPDTANVSDKLASDSEELHVLAVDDSLVDRKVIERLLKISSCKVTAVESGSRALQYLGLDGEQSSVGSFDGLKVNLIMTDYCMPGMTGYELLKKLKQTSSTLRKVPVVIMSSENIMARIDRCLEEGAEDFLVKPVKLSDVKRLKECILKGEGDNKEIQMHKRMLNDDPASVLPPARKLTDDPSLRPPARKLNDDPSSVPPPARKLTDDPSSVRPPARKLNDDPSSVPPPARKLKDDPLSMLPPASSLLPKRLACDLSPSILPCPSSSTPQSLSIFIKAT